MLKKDCFLKGNKVYLRSLKEEDLQGGYAFWLNDSEITTYNSHGRFPITLESLRSYIKSAYSSNNTLILAILDSETDKHIGNISLQAINWVDRSAEIAFLLGEKEFLGKGVMYSAGKILINHAFKILNLHRIHCGTSSENIGMQKLAIKLGMQQEGIRREAIFKHGQYFDIVEYGLIINQH